MIRLLSALLCLCAVISVSSAWAASRSVLQGSHGDRSVMPKSCRACHRGMSMAITGEEEVCLNCHGDSTRRAEMESRGYLRTGAGGRLQNVGLELRKPYSHPVLSTKGVHLQREALPEEVINASRHSECVDCHDPHVVEAGRPYAGMVGKRVGNFITEIDQEFQLCYKCHSDSANLPSSSTSKHAEFKTTNPSYHPVEGEGANAYVISLKEPYRARNERPGDISIITCSDCHGSDDPNGPKGPHGSNYRGLLVSHYEMEDGRPEGDYAYDLCYKCHDRASILGNESFAYHAQHIEGNGSGNPGTSCFTCHDAHGSTRYQYLIRFNEDVVEPNAEDKLEFKAQGVASRHGSCSLNCHGAEHAERAY